MIKERFLHFTVGIIQSSLTFELFERMRNSTTEKMSTAHGK